MQSLSRLEKGEVVTRINPRTTVTVKCKDHLRIAVKPTWVNAWFGNGSPNLLPELQQRLKWVSVERKLNIFLHLSYKVGNSHRSVSGGLLLYVESWETPVGWGKGRRRGSGRRYILHVSRPTLPPIKSVILSPLPKPMLTIVTGHKTKSFISPGQIAFENDAPCN